MTRARTTHEADTKSRPESHAARLAALAIALALTGCVSAPAADKAAGGDAEAKSAADAAKSVDRLERQLHVATERVGIARTQEHEQGAVNALSAAKIDADLKDLEDQLVQFERVDMPARIGKAKLDLVLAKDGLAEQEEELAQLELTYKDEDFADKTREIVLNRGKRRVERAKQRLELETRDEQALEQIILPHEHEKLARQIELKRHDLERARHEGEMQAQEKHIALESAELEVIRAETELAAARAGSGK